MNASRRRTVASLLVLTCLFLFAALSCAPDSKSGSDAATSQLQTELRQHTDEKAQVAAHLARFDELDFDVFSNQKWDRLSESHADDIVVTWPDGHQTNGIAKHIEDLKAMFVYAPDTKISTHPIKFGSGDWTCATGVMTGTFSQPMPTPDKTIPPTGKSFELTMATIARWEDGKMIEESLFWDNQEFMRQIGLAR